MKCNCLCGCAVSLSFCLYLQRHTFARIDSLWAKQSNWCWNQHGDKSLQWAASTAIEGCNVHYRYVCTLWRPCSYILFYNCGVWYSYSRFISDHKGPPLHHIVSHYNSARIFITFSLIHHSITCCSQIHICNALCSDRLCFLQSVQYICAVTGCVSLNQYSIYVQWPVVFPSVSTVYMCSNQLCFPQSVQYICAVTCCVSLSQYSIYVQWPVVFPSISTVYICSERLFPSVCTVYMCSNRLCFPQSVQYICAVTGCVSLGTVYMCSDRLCVPQSVQYICAVTSCFPRYIIYVQWPVVFPSVSTVYLCSDLSQSWRVIKIVQPQRAALFQQWLHKWQHNCCCFVCVIWNEWSGTQCFCQYKL